MVEPRLLNIGFAGVAWPGVEEGNSVFPPVAPEVGVELVPGAFPVLAPNRLVPDVLPPLNRPPPVVPTPPAAVVVGVLEAPPNRLGVAGLAALPNILPPDAPVDAGVVPPPPKSEGPVAEGVPVALAPPPNREPAGFAALFVPDFRLPNKPPPPDGVPPAPLLFWELPKAKPLEGVEDCAPPKSDGAAVEEEAGAEVPGVPPPKLNAIVDVIVCRFKSIRWFRGSTLLREKESWLSSERGSAGWKVEAGDCVQQ